MVSFRPHTLNVISSSKGTYDDSGKYIPAGDTTTQGVRCRYERNGRASTIALTDGKVYVYAYMVYLDVNCPEIAYGDVVELFDQQGKSVAKLPVQGFQRSQLNAKLWL